MRQATSQTASQATGQAASQMTSSTTGQTASATSINAVKHTFQQQLGRRLKNLRLSQGYSQTEVGRQIDMSRVGVGYIEQGRRAPSLQTLEGLARLYSMTVSQLVDVGEPAWSVSEPVQGGGAPMPRQ